MCLGTPGTAQILKIVMSIEGLTFTGIASTGVDNFGIEFDLLSIYLHEFYFNVCRWLSLAGWLIISTLDVWYLALASLLW